MTSLTLVVVNLCHFQDFLYYLFFHLNFIWLVSTSYCCCHGVNQLVGIHHVTQMFFYWCQPSRRHLGNPCDENILWRVKTFVLKQFSLQCWIPISHQELEPFKLHELLSTSKAHIRDHPSNWKGTSKDFDIHLDVSKAHLESIEKH